jgi:hypothetical protein
MPFRRNSSHGIITTSIVLPLFVHVLFMVPLSLFGYQMFTIYISAACSGPARLLDKNCFGSLTSHVNIGDMNVPIVSIL